MPSAESSLNRAVVEDRHGYDNVVRKGLRELNGTHFPEEIQLVTAASPSRNRDSINCQYFPNISPSYCDNEVQSLNQNHLSHQYSQRLDQKHDIFLSLADKMPWKHPLVIAKPDVQVRTRVDEVRREGDKGIGN